MLTEQTVGNYRKNFREQTRRWVAGEPVHNPLDGAGRSGGGGECCPDFSCCFPDLLEPDHNKRMALALDTCDRISWMEPADLIT